MNRLHPTLCYQQILPQGATTSNFTLRDQTGNIQNYMHLINEHLELSTWNSSRDHIANGKNTNSF